MPTTSQLRGAIVRHGSADRDSSNQAVQRSIMNDALGRPLRQFLGISNPLSDEMCARPSLSEEHHHA
jgi:hypothetical protein